MYASLILHRADDTRFCFLFFPLFFLFEGALDEGISPRVSGTRDTQRLGFPRLRVIGHKHST